jgi:hypothetical protein
MAGRNTGAQSPKQTLPRFAVAVSRLTLSPSLILVIDISFGGSHFSTAFLKPKTLSTVRNQTRGFSTALKSWDPHKWLGRKDVPIATSGRFIFNAK